MAVEFRCPDCRAKLRLAEAPPPGEEIECPKCGNVFAAPRAGDDGDDDDAPRPKKKKAPAADEGKKDGGDKPKPKDGAPKKRRSKKKKANPAVLIGAIAGGVIAVGVVVTVLILLLGKQAPAVTMMSHFPDDVEVAAGVNLGQLQRYTLFYKDFEGALQIGDPARRGKDPLSKAFGEDFINMVDNVVWGYGGPKATMVVRTKKEFDPGVLAKLGGREETVDGVKVYSVPRLDLAGPFNMGADGKVFAPNNRTVVVATKASAGDLQKMVHGNAGEDGFVARMGPLGKRVSKGSVWIFGIDRSKTWAKNGVGFSSFILGTSGLAGDKKAAAAGGSLNPGSLRGMGLRTSLGAKSVRFELACWCENAEQASTASQNYNKSELSKGDEGTPPREWVDFAGRTFGDKILIAQILSHLSFTASGDLFLIKTEADVSKVQMRMSEWLGNAMGKPSQ